MNVASDGTATGSQLALCGRVVTMDTTGTIIDDGVVYVRDGSIVAVQPAPAPRPAGFADVKRVRSDGTVFPGLIELHNHLPYSVLQLWPVPKPFTNRDQWSGPSTKDYRRLISGPMGVLGRRPDVVPSIVRYAEVRCLLGGTTTSQGVALASDSGIVRHFRGLVRNVESTGDPGLPAARTHIADVDATDADRFLARISGTQKLILHLSEGTDTAARQHFQALHLPDGRWAITDNLIGIHCAALTAADFDVFAGHGGSMVWSPLSNLLLYGKTADIGAAIAAGVPVALGSDWAPSGSKNLLGELKVARLAADSAGAPISGRQLVDMVTSTPARMLGWHDSLGSIEPGKRADLISVHGAARDPYRTLIEANEADIDLVLIDGVPRVGRSPLMTGLGITAGDQVKVGGVDRRLNLTQPDADPDVQSVSVADAIAVLEQALSDLPSATMRATSVAVPDRLPGGAVLAVEGVIDNHMSSRPHLPWRGRLTGPDLPTAAADPRPAGAAPPGPLPALTLDPLTAVDNPGFYDSLKVARNLPDDIASAIAALRPSDTRTR